MVRPVVSATSVVAVMAAGSTIISNPYLKFRLDCRYVRLDCRYGVHPCAGMNVSFVFALLVRVQSSVFLGRRHVLVVKLTRNCHNRFV